MMEIALLFAWPFAALLTITAIHAYLGLHVVQREVIFVDLSLAQIAALGASIAVLLGLDLHGLGAYLCSLGFTLIGAAFFAFTRSDKSEVPQEAIIGIVYAVSAAAAIMIMDRLPEGAEHLKHIMVGNLLAVTPVDVYKMSALYAVVGALHWYWREPLRLISESPEKARKKGLNLRLWDFAFYATFGLIVTVSVPIVGVLLVFSYLIVPGVAAVLFYKSLRPRLLFAWAMGALVSVIGMGVSFGLDSPTGATIVCTFGAGLLILAGYRWLTHHRPA
jgi:zinc/manganese transport system permease protein